MRKKTIPPDGIYVTGKRMYIDGTGLVLHNVHRKADCRGPYCPIHRPSEHSMRAFPTHFRLDRYLMERICPHGVGHPDPDDPSGDTVHGCDGCCMDPVQFAKMRAVARAEYEELCGG